MAGDFKTSDLLNAIRNGASATYIERVPVATQANLAAIGSAILDYDQIRAEFVYTLFTKIGLTLIKNKLFENPLKEFKLGMLDFGQDIEEIFVDLVTAAVYDPSVAETEVFKRSVPDIKAVFHRINREDMYKTTTQDQDLRKAFTSEGAMQNLIEKIITSIYTSDNFDEFLIMKGAFQRYLAEGKFTPIVVTAVTSEATAKAALSKIKEISNNMTFMKSDYNYAGVKNHTPKDEQIVLIGTSFDALVDVEVLASAFNMDKADFIGRRILIDDFGGAANVVCMLVDKGWFMMYDRLIKAEQIYNPQGMYFNHFLHHHGVYSVSPFENAVAFVTAAPTVASIEITPATITVVGANGGTFQIIPISTGTNNPPAKCTYASSVPAKAVVNSMGMVSVIKGAAAGEVTITATNVFDATKTDTTVITIS